MSTIACAATLAACGESEDPEPSIPKGTGDQIVASLENIRGLVAEGDCEGAEAAAQNVRNAIGELPSDVPDDIQQTLVQASDNLVQQTREQCEPAEEEPPPDTGATGEEGVAP